MLLQKYGLDFNASFIDADTAIDVAFLTTNYYFSFAEILLPDYFSKLLNTDKYYDLIFSGYTTSAYTPFALPIIGGANWYDSIGKNSLTRFSYNTHLTILDTLFSKALKVLEANNLPASLLPQFIMLTCCRIYYNDPNDFAELISIDGTVNFTTEQVITYLKHSTNAEHIVDLWELGVLPEQVEDYMLNYTEAPAEWVKVLFKDNHKQSYEFPPKSIDIFRKKP